jgi:hypothetical protein
VLKGGVWYLVAHVGERPQTYRASDIVEVTVTGEHFERPNDFDLAAFWTKASRAYEVGLYSGNAKLRISPRGVIPLDQLGSPIAQTVADAVRPVDTQGWVSVSIPIEGTD